MNRHRKTRATRQKTPIPVHHSRRSSRLRQEMIPLDTHAIRQEALEHHRRTERTLRQFSDQLKNYREKDVPGFRGWMHRTFASVLAKQRELLAAIEDKRHLLLEIDALSMRYDIPEEQAYARVLWRRAHPEEAEEEDRRFLEEEQKLAEACRKAASEEADAWDDAGAIPEHEDEAFREFSDFASDAQPASPAASRKSAALSPDAHAIKQTYRTIVRRLHPDHHGQLSEAKLDLWHEAQEAYRRQDLNALYSILSRCENGESTLSRHSPVSLIQRLTLKLTQSLRAVKREIQQVKRGAAWNYERNIQDARFVRRVQNGLTSTSLDLQEDLDHLNALLGRLARQSRQRKRVPKPPKSSESRKQDEDW